MQKSDIDRLITELEKPENDAQVLRQGNEIIATQRGMANLLGCSTSNVGTHLKRLIESGVIQRETASVKIWGEVSRGRRRVMVFYRQSVIKEISKYLRGPHAAQVRQWLGVEV
jgi:hypothetical protein